MGLRACPAATERPGSGTWRRHFLTHRCETRRDHLWAFAEQAQRAQPRCASPEGTRALRDFCVQIVSLHALGCLGANGSPRRSSRIPFVPHTSRQVSQQAQTSTSSSRYSRTQRSRCRRSANALQIAAQLETRPRPQRGDARLKLFCLLGKTPRLRVLPSHQCLVNAPLEQAINYRRSSFLI